MLENTFFYSDYFISLPTFSSPEYICHYYKMRETYAENLSNQETENESTENHKPPLLRNRRIMVQQSFVILVLI